jgi:hypothetical protein
MNTLKIFLSTALVAITFSTPQVPHSMERASRNERQKNLPGMQYKTEKLKKRLRLLKGVQAATMNDFTLYEQLFEHIQAKRIQKSEQEVVKAWKAKEAQKQLRNDFKKAKKRGILEHIMNIRETRLDSSLMLYTILNSPHLTYGELNESWEEVESVSELMLVGRNEFQYTARFPIDMMAWNASMQDLRKYLRIANLKDEYGIMRSAYIISIWSPFLHSNNILDILNLYKKDIKDTMKLYQKLHGVPHPRWGEYYWL